MRANLDSVFYVSKAVAKGMIARKSGRIINIASVQAELARTNIAPYTASKGGVKMPTKGMATDWSKHGLRVNGIAPGYFKTVLNKALVEDEKFTAWLAGRTPMGSAMRFPHVQGAFRESLVCLEAQAHPVAEGVTLQEAAMAEPLAVALHATRRSGSLMGRRVLVSGSGPIGALVVSAARRAGAAEIVVTDIADGALGFAARVGAERVINVAKTPEALSAYAADKGHFDALFEASAA
jgi:short chain dehydrogenase